MSLSCVRFHVHKLKINCSHNMCSQDCSKEKKKKGNGRGGFFTWACHDAVQLIIIITVSLSLCHSPHCLPAASWLSHPSPPVSCSYSWFPRWIGSLQHLLFAMIGTIWHHQVSWYFFLFFLLVCIKTVAGEMVQSETNHPSDSSGAPWSPSNINKSDAGLALNMMLTLVIKS